MEKDQIGKLYETHSRRHLGIAGRFVRNTEDAEDVRQEAFLSVLQNAASLNEAGNVLGYIDRTVASRAIDQLRRRQTHPQTVPIEGD